MQVWYVFKCVPEGDHIESLIGGQLIHGCVHGSHRVRDGSVSCASAGFYTDHAKTQPLAEAQEGAGTTSDVQQIASRMVPAN